MVIFSMGYLISLECKFQELCRGLDFCLFCILLYCQCLDQCLVYALGFNKNVYNAKMRMCILAGVAQWLSFHPGTKRSPIQFSIRAHALVVGLIPSRGSAGESQSMIFSHH